MISILIPVYHNHKYSLSAIRSCLYYSNKIDKIYVFDDNPTSPLMKFDKYNLLRHDKIIYHINNRNVGRIKNYNKLVKACKSNFYMMLDGDDLLSKDIDFDSIQSQLKLDNEIFLVVGLCKEFNFYSKLTYSHRGPRKFGKVQGLELLYDWVGSKNLLPHSACIFQTKMVKNLGYYSDKFNNPEILLVRKILLQSTVLSLNCVFSYWRKHNKNISLSFESGSLFRELKPLSQIYNLLKQHSDLKRKLWIIKSVIFYLISSFHIIFSKTNSRYRVWMFYEKFIYEHAKKNFIYYISLVLAAPKIIALFSLTFLLGDKTFRSLMISRKNWLYVK